jgi:hypothetical protein
VNTLVHEQNKKKKKGKEKKENKCQKGSDPRTAEPKEHGNGKQPKKR